jgi:hypothetical protein
VENRYKYPIDAIVYEKNYPNTLFVIIEREIKPNNIYGKNRIETIYQLESVGYKGNKMIVKSVEENIIPCSNTSEIDTYLDWYNHTKDLYEYFGDQEYLATLNDIELKMTVLGIQIKTNTI